jgi:glutathione-regulated potassium-efflux system protein KefB
MHLDHILVVALVLLLITAFSVALFSRLGLGSVIGFLAAGVLVGPSGLNITDNVEALQQVAELGVVLLLFVIGLEMEPQKLWAMRRTVFGLGTAQVLVTGSILSIYIAVFPSNGAVAAVLGLGLALSSTAFVLKVLGDRGEMASPHGRASFGILLLQDLAVVPLLALVPILSHGAAAAGPEPLWEKAIFALVAVTGVVIVGRYLLPRVLRRCALSRNMEAFAMFSMLAALGAAYAMKISGLSMALGAFMMGMLLSASEYRLRIEATVSPFKGMFLGLFFISVGMSIDVNFLAFAGPAIAVHVAIILIIKTIVLLTLARAFGLDLPTAVRTAFLLSQCGEFGFVLFGAARATGLLNDFQFALAIVTITVSMVATPLMVRLGDRLAARVRPPAGDDIDTQVTEVSDDFDRHVILAGHGPMGRTVSLMLEKQGIPHIAFDVDPREVRHSKQAGFRVYYGDLSEPPVLEVARLSQASAIVITIEDAAAAERVVRTVLGLRPSVPIIARARDLAVHDRLRTDGVRTAVPIAAEGGLALGQIVLEAVGVPHDEADALALSFRDKNYAVLRERS